MKKTVQNILNRADIEINGQRPWDIQVNNPGFYKRVLAGGSLALGESYMDGWWECKAIDQFIDKIFRAKTYAEIKTSPQVIWNTIKARIMNLQSKARAGIVGKKHYDIGNDLYKIMLDKRMNYSCGYWKNAETLEEAQKAKLNLICRKLKLKPGMTVLDIGCGWGNLSQFIAEKHQVKVTGITISKEQFELANNICKNFNIEIRLQDYRDLNEKFDRIVSIGMFEHVGYKNYKRFIQIVSRCLKNKGLFLLHTIGRNDPAIRTDPWIDKYIFPNSMLPSASQIVEASEHVFKLEDWHNFGTDYDKTLMAWHKNFNENWDRIKVNYGEQFYRMWNYYLLICAGSFRARRNQLWQIMFSKIESPTKYESER